MNRSDVKKPLVILTDPLIPSVVNRLLKPHARVRIAPPSRAGLLPLLRDADALISLLSCRIDHELLDAAPRLKVVGSFAVGYDNIDLAACHARGVRVVNTPDVLTRSTAELTLTLLMAAARRVPEGERMCRSGRFTKWEPGLLLGQELKGRTAVLVGPGRIGQETARLFRGLGLKTVFISREDSQSSISSKLKKAQILSLHLPLNEQTRHWLNGTRLALLPRDAIVLNTTRGPTLDEKALIQALRAGLIFAAGLDVYEHEPRIPRALRSLPNTVLLPHVGSATQKAREAMAELAIRGVLGILSGKKVRNEVKFPRRKAQRSTPFK